MGRQKSTSRDSLIDSLRKQGQVVLVLQGGGALGAYQVGVYQALHEAGIEPDWIIGTSIGAINAALIAGAPPEERLGRLDEFWNQITSEPVECSSLWSAWMGQSLCSYTAVMNGVRGFFELNPLAMLGAQAHVGVGHASLYSVEPLRRTLSGLVDVDRLRSKQTRLTMGAVNVRNGEMTYFDNHHCDLTLDHVMASGALPPAFPAVQIDGEHYWDGGIYSNTPIEVVLDENPRRNAVAFAVNVWQSIGKEPASLWDVLGRQKDIQYSSRVKSHVGRQRQLHQLRHIVRELGMRLPAEVRQEPEVKEMLSFSCSTTLHLVGLLAPILAHEDHTKDIDFTREGVRARRAAGYEHVMRALDRRPWEDEVDVLQGVVIHECGATEDMNGC